MGGHLGKNVVIAVSLLAAGFLAAWLRFRPHLGTEGAFTDGQRTIEIERIEALRYAVWDRPQTLAGEVNTGEDEHAPAISPDGRYLVFVVGERGLGTDLWIADLDARGMAREPRPLPGINSAADELAPAFAADGALLFASNRPGGAGGLDLWRAPYERGVFDAAERLEGNINTEADETDPAAVPGTGEILFASNRRGADEEQGPRGRGRLGDFDVYGAEPLPRTVEGEARWEVLPVDAINTPFDERDPALTSDGRALLFASDRPVGDERSTEGDFDLYRASRAPRDRNVEENPDEWLAPRPLEGVNVRGSSERHPRPTADGFALLFSRGVALEDGEDTRGDGEAWDVWRATSRELVRTPGRPVGWREIIVLVALLLLALLAALAKRWRGLDVIYKAFLISLLIHLALLIWSKEVAPQSDPVELREGEASRVRVRLVEDPNSMRVQRNQERGGALEAARDAVEAAVDPSREQAPSAEQRETESAPTAMSDLARSAAEAAPAPSRLATESPDRTEAPREVTTEVATAQESFERLTGAAPTMTVDARTTEADRSAAASSEARRQAEAMADTSQVTPEATSTARTDLARSERSESPTANSPARREVTVDRGAEVATTAQASDVAAPSEDFTRLTGDQRSADRPMEVASADAADLGARARAGQEAAPSAAPAEGRAEVSTELAPSASSSLARSERSADAPAPGPMRLPTDVARAEGSRGTPAVDVAQPAADPFGTGPLLAEDAPTFDALDGAGEAATALDRTRPAEGAGAGAPSAPVAAAPSATLPSTGELTPTATSDLTRSAPAGPASAPPMVALGPKRLEPERTAPADRGREVDVAAPVTEAPAKPAEVTVAEGPPADDLTPVDTGAPLRRTATEAPAAAPGLIASAAPDEDRSRFDNPVPTRRDIATPAAPGPAIAAPIPIAKPNSWDKTPYQSRSGARKLAALEEYGGTAETEAAVEKGLAYLAKRQRSDGRWGGKVVDEKYGTPMVGKTGLALLAFMGAGHTTTSKSLHSDVVDRGIGFLKGQQNPVSGHFGNTSSYGHAIATYALGEAYALTKDPSLKRPLERAVQHIMSCQSESRDPLLDGGWTYFYSDGRSSDRWPRASITAWQVMALESAKLGGIEVPKSVFTRARTFLVNTWDPRRGAFRYSHDPSRLRSDYPLLPGSTPAAMFALSLLGADITEAQFGPARNFVLERSPNGYRYTGDDDFVFKAQGNLYFWYYGTLAMFRAGGDSWRRWNAAMKDTLVPSQDMDGSWRPISIYAGYAQDRGNDRVYTTAMNVLTLEVYYRYFTPLLKVE